MIESKSYHLDWIIEVQKNIGTRVDPKLIEKVIYALLFLEQLTLNGLNFIFKGGTALVLATKTPKRFSIDIDIITEQSPKEIEIILEKISQGTVFTHWADDNNRKHTQDVPIGHYKMYYKSNVDNSVEPILLDLLFTSNPYPELMEIPMNHPWLATSGEVLTVKMPTFDAILGDKLTAFAPKTTGILYVKNRPVEIIKQLYDIAFLFDNMVYLEIVKSSYNKIVKEEIGFRKLKIGVAEVLKDTWNACYTLAERNTKSEEFKHLQLGIRNFTNFTISKFSIEEAIIAAAKVAYLTVLIKSNFYGVIEKYKTPLEIKDWLVEEQDYNKLNKLKKNNPEAFYYWYQSFLLNSNNGKNTKSES
ncbi:nucleotidyl transferase AbiEii/AbiGii toxin family protein [Lutibacter sp.]|uniref:nucleotidyl transferase AbiEii/AbiGii toxin family protein n=1 Tax=Lutibacter sp. TaxID=1925666 RepID=UPI0025C2CDDC|nr:nucleotidyl transferase AbiEii/AbiGii toxin family protein [Lutibacter sp.]MCF6182729.1 nucleotidyl transferase AbiEii/AbiGii toxin family protein [Lutibacter sp.]